MVIGIEDVVRLYVRLPFRVLPRQTGIGKNVWLVVLYLTVEVGIGSHTVLPPEVQS